MEAVQSNLLVALGIPQGLLSPATGRELRGFVRRGGDFVELSPDAYVLWVRALAPQTTSSLAQWYKGRLDAETVLRNMEDARLVLRVNWRNDGNVVIPNVRLLPLGMNWASNPDNPGTVIIASPDGVPRLFLNPIPFSIWSLCDGQTGLPEVCSIVSKEHNLPRKIVEENAIGTLLAVMANRLAYIDVETRIEMRESVIQ